MLHWTKDIKRENEVLRAALRLSLTGSREAISSRLDKQAKFPAPGDYGLGYTACAQEAALRNDEARSCVLDLLVDNGISLDGRY